MAGYSGTPLAAKLGIREEARVATIGAPPDYAKLLAPLPAGAVIGSRIGAATQIVHVFATRRSELGAQLQRLRTCLDSQAVVWVSWPKKAAKMPTDITEDTIRALALPLGFVDVKVCAVSDVWSGLKLVVRKELR